ncbi:uncharacterized protein L969DRAFT_94930 [Mixia osmundae IAM 14324]|uniref:AA1-like domain-containing protein n=1 Tax=Mixia osmundae (strain CBS 9802 / IAM 14324 / JCM 22182 / KY 12970) TaxID=764103 RepID=G7E1A5_MIXOS|nr:uncharacterized protein L969DRAFT_94930 [Mixia osmundae IAM 14324]KEI38747.1 hypothetical protein L969DRAFT_94930 [Mixia osmundae IAM 14324]GAA96615.1 hypothetical protein E5Q_03285 [Mixia osmundae IAM 14324]
MFTKVFKTILALACATVAAAVVLPVKTEHECLFAADLLNGGNILLTLYIEYESDPVYGDSYFDQMKYDGQTFNCAIIGETDSTSSSCTVESDAYSLPFTLKTSAEDDISYNLRDAKWKGVGIKSYQMVCDGQLMPIKQESMMFSKAIKIAVAIACATAATAVVLPVKAEHECLFAADLLTGGNILLTLYLEYDADDSSNYAYSQIKYNKDTYECAKSDGSVNTVSQCYLGTDELTMRFILTSTTKNELSYNLQGATWKGVGFKSYAMVCDGLLIPIA